MTPDRDMLDIIITAVIAMAGISCLLIGYMRWQERREVTK